MKIQFRKITLRKITPELRAIGSIVRLINPYYRMATFKFCNVMMKARKGRKPKGMRYEQRLVSRTSKSIVNGMVRICIYSPLEPVSNVPGVLWIHGGGYAIGTPEHDEGFIREFVRHHNCVVVAPDYCLSTEAPYPAALEDCYTALLWLKKNAKKLGVRSNQLIVAGDSAGGGLTAALSIYARDKGSVAIAYQMPLYPMIDDRMITRSSRENDAPMWNTKSNINGWKLYLGDLYGTDKVPPYAAPARLKDFTGLPPAFSYIGDIDPFYEETIAYMEQLRAAGVPVKYYIFKGCFHAFDSVAERTTPAKQARRLLREAFAEAVEVYFAEQR